MKITKSAVTKTQEQGAPATKSTAKAAVAAGHAKGNKDAAARRKSKTLS